MKDAENTIGRFVSMIGLDPSLSGKLDECRKKLDAEGKLTELIDGYLRKGLTSREAYDEFISRLGELSEATGQDVYLSNETALILLCEPSLGLYETKGYTKEQFVENMRDIIYKNRECNFVHGRDGLFVTGWYHNFLSAARFKLGRLQFEYFPYKGPDVTICGQKLTEGDRAVKIHIPSSKEPFTGENCLDSYKKAYNFFKNEYFADHPFFGRMFYFCISWLLYKGQEDYLPSGSNILRFHEDFDIVNTVEYETDPDLWRVFGKDATLPPADLPENTSLQRAYKKRMLEKKPFGKGVGVFLFDGVRIIK